MRLIEVILHDSVDIDTGNIDFFDSWRTFLRAEHNRFGRFPADTPSATIISNARSSTTHIVDRLTPFNCSSRTLATSHPRAVD